MADQSITLSSSWFDYDSGRDEKIWRTARVGDGTIQAGFLPSGTSGTYLDRVEVHQDGRVELRFTGGSPDDDLSTEFETTGSFTITVGSNSLTVDMSDLGDTSEPYTGAPSNSAQVTAFYNAIGTSGVSGVLTLTVPDVAACVYSGYGAWSGWTPATSSQPAGQSFTQRRTRTRTLTSGDANTCTDLTETDTRAATGTGTTPPPSGGGVPATPPFSLSDIAEEFDDDYPDNLPYSLSEFVAGGSYVPTGQVNGDGDAIPEQAPLSMSQFAGAMKSAGIFNPPRMVQVIRVMAMTARIDWIAPATGSQLPDGTAIEVTAYIGNFWKNSEPEPSADDSQDTTTHSDLTGLEPDTDYTYRLAARYGEHGDSAYVRGPFKTTVVRPGIPGTPVTGDVTETTAAFTCSAPTTGGAVEDYRWRWDDDTSPVGGETVTTGTTAAVTLTGLTGGQRYEIDVRAENAGGSSSYSGDRVFTTDTPSVLRPGTPGTPVLGNRTQTTARLSCTAPTTGGAVVDYVWRYDDDSSPVGGTEVKTGTTRAVTLTGLTAGTRYEADVAAENAGGRSGFSGDRVFTTIAATAAIFNPPRSDRVINIAATTARLDWTAPASGSQTADGTAVSVTAYIGNFWKSSDPEPAGDVSQGTTTHAALTGLEPETSYAYRLAARYGANGDSAYVRGTFTTIAQVVELPNATAPTLIIRESAIPDTITEDETLDITVIPSGGVYDTISYTWVIIANRGTISGSGSTVTYNPPDVTSRVNVTVQVDATVGGTGTNAKSGTTDTTSSTEDDSVGFGVLPVTTDTTNPPRLERLDDDDQLPSRGTTWLNARWFAPTDIGTSDWDCQANLYESDGTTEIGTITDEDTASGSTATTRFTGLTSGTTYRLQGRAKRSTSTTWSDWTSQVALDTR